MLAFKEGSFEGGAFLLLTVLSEKFLRWPIKQAS